MLSDSGFRVNTLRYSVWGLGFDDNGKGIIVQTFFGGITDLSFVVLLFTVCGSGFRVLGVGFRV